jgi:hypothetical protein
MASFSALSMWATAFACGVGVLAYLCFSVVPPRLRLVTGIVGGAVFGLQPVAALALMVLANSAA